MKCKMFKNINCMLALFCVSTIFMNNVDVNVIDCSKAKSSYRGNDFEYLSTDNSFSVIKNGELIGNISTNKKFRFQSRNHLLQCNAVVVAGKIIAAGFAAAATGGSFAAAAGAAMTSAINAIGGGAFVGASASVALPGAACVEATVAGAAEAAAAAAVTGASMATLTAMIVPVLIGAGIGAGLT